MADRKGQRWSCARLTMTWKSLQDAAQSRGGWWCRREAQHLFGSAVDLGEKKVGWVVANPFPPFSKNTWYWGTRLLKRWDLRKGFLQTVVQGNISWISNLKVCNTYLRKRKKKYLFGRLHCTALIEFSWFYNLYSHLSPASDSLFHVPGLFYRFV